MRQSVLKAGQRQLPFAVLAVSLVVAVALGGCGKPPEPTEVVRPVLVQKAVPVPAIEQDVYSGEVRARHETDLGFRIPGKVVARLVDVGAQVKKGQVLARLDPADVQQQLETSRAQVAAASTDRDFTKSELARFQSLYEQKFISKATLEAKENAYNAAAARYKQAQSQLNLSQNQSSYATLEAAQDGVVTATLVEVGQVVAAGQAVVRVARPEEKEVVVAVPEARIAQIRGAQQILVRLWAEPDKVYTGRLREIAPNADATTRTFTAKVTVVDAPPEVRLGMTANVLLGKPEQRTVFALPLTAIYHQQGGEPAVWVVDPQSSQVQLRTVKIGQYREQVVILDSGLKPGELVVTAGVHKLQAGKKVQPQEIAPPPPSAASTASTRANLASWAPDMAPQAHAAGQSAPVQPVAASAGTAVPNESAPASRAAVRG